MNLTLNQNAAFLQFSITGIAPENVSIFYITFTKTAVYDILFTSVWIKEKICEHEFELHSSERIRQTSSWTHVFWKAFQVVAIIFDFIGTYI